MEEQESLFDFNNISYSKFPANIKARYTFKSDLVKIPDSDYYLNIDKNLWIIYDIENNNLFSMTQDQFNDVYLASNFKSQRYLEFIHDSYHNEYNPNNSDLFLYEEIFGDLIEKPAPIRKKLKLVWDLLLKKKIFISKYF